MAGLKQHKNGRLRLLLISFWLLVSIAFLFWVRPDFWESGQEQFRHAERLAADGKPAESLEKILRMLQFDPEERGLHLFRGTLELQLGRLDDARLTFSSLLEREPRDWKARAGLVQALTQLSRREEALDLLQETEKMELDSGEMRERGKLLAGLKAHRLALRDFLFLLKESPQDSDLLREATSMALAVEDWELAATLAQRLQQTSIHPDERRQALENQSLALRAQGKIEEAYDLNRRAASPENLETRAVLALQLGKFREASQLFLRLAEQNPERIDLLPELAYALERSDQSAEAEKVYRRLLRQDGASPTSLARFAWMLNRQGRYQDAWQVVNRLPATADSKEDEWIELRARTAFWAGRLEEAKKLFSRLVNARPENRDVQHQWAFILKETGEPGRAEEVYLRLIRDETDRQALTQYAWLLNSEHRFQESWRLLSSRSIPPLQDAEELELWTKTALWAGYPEKAESLLRSLLQVRPDASDLWKSVADSYLILGRQAEAIRALKAYSAEHQEDTGALERIARLLSGQGEREEAERYYQSLHASEPANFDWTLELARIYESNGKLEQALELYLSATKDQQSLKYEPELFLRAARINRWLSRPQESVHWYRLWLERFSNEASLSEVQLELAEALLDSGDPVAALKTLALVSRQGQDNSRLLLAGARASWQVGEYEATVNYLEELSSRRPLQQNEKLWLAGAYRQTGRTRQAVRLYQELSQVASPVKSEALEALGDLGLQSGQAATALQAYSQLAEQDHSPELQLKLARAAAAAARTDTAVTAYQNFLRLRPEEVGGRIETARFFASVGRFEEALKTVGGLAPDQISLELRKETARWYLACKRFEEAEAAARLAVLYSASDFEAQLLLAESLYLQGNSGEAGRILDRLYLENPADPEVLRWLGELSASRDRHLKAYRYFKEAIERGGEQPQDLWLLASRSARIRGDLARAWQSLDQARRLGAWGQPAEKAGEALSRQLVGRILFPASSWSDRNDLSLSQVGVGASFNLEQMARLRIQFLRGELQQRENGFTRSSGQVSLVDLYPTPALNLSLTAGLEDYGRGGALVTGEVKGVYHFEDGSFAGGGFNRQTLFSEHDSGEVRQFNRILDLESLGPDFRVNRFSGFLDKMVWHDSSWRVESGLDDFQDDNRRFHAYTHYQIPLNSRQGRWLALRPNFYFESSKRENPFYFSPDNHFSLGVGIHTIRKFKGWGLEVEFNPQWIGTEGATGLGGQGVVNLTGRWKGLEWKAGGFLFYDDRNNYLLWNLAGQVTLPLSK